MNIRTLGVGIAAGGYFMTHGFKVVSYMENRLHESPLVAFHMALNKIDPNTASAVGDNFVITLFWAALCLGSGLFVAGIIWPLVEEGLFLVVDSVWLTIKALVVKPQQEAGTSAALGIRRN